MRRQAPWIPGGKESPRLTGTLSTKAVGAAVCLADAQTARMPDGKRTGGRSRERALTMLCGSM